MKKAYLHQDGKTMELRIPVTKQQATLLKRIIELSGLTESYVAGYFAENGLQGLSHFVDGNMDETPSWLITDSEANLVELFSAYTRFCDEGWLPREALQVFLRKLTIDYISAFELKPEEKIVAFPVLMDAYFHQAEALSH